MRPHGVRALQVVAATLFPLAALLVHLVEGPVRVPLLGLVEDAHLARVFAAKPALDLPRTHRVAISHVAAELRQRPIAVARRLAEAEAAGECRNLVVIRLNCHVERDVRQQRADPPREDQSRAGTSQPEDFDRMLPQGLVTAVVLMELAAGEGRYRRSPLPTDPPRAVKVGQCVHRVEDHDQQLQRELVILAVPLSRGGDPRCRLAHSPSTCHPRVPRNAKSDRK
eukprot:4072590-Prymnesium_polylepis.1